MVSSCQQAIFAKTSDRKIKIKVNELHKGDTIRASKAEPGKSSRLAWSLDLAVSIIPSLKRRILNF